MKMQQDVNAGQTEIRGGKKICFYHDKNDNYEFYLFKKQG